MPDPIVILQMQRMGDLVLTFPLILWLRRRFPDHPVTLVAEPLFFRELAAISPDVAFLPHDKARSLAGSRARSVINLSHREEAAALAGSIQAERRLGPVVVKNGERRMPGFWQQYRASLVHNNRHNRFHWADLNALDVIPQDIFRTTTWQQPNPAPDSEGRIGVFVGASIPDKRPAPAFWAGLVRELLGRGFSPLLFGGPLETDLGREVARMVGLPAINLCGKFPLPAFLRALSTLSLFITPDTGPMHLSAWMGIPTFNLSMGPVSPWETGPFQDGHYVLQANLGCTGCWQCSNPAPLDCRRPFHAPRIAALVQRMLGSSPDSLASMHLPGLRLYRTARDEHGLFTMDRLDSGPVPAAREALAQAWKRYFLALGNRIPMEEASTRWQDLAHAHPDLARAFRAHLGQVARTMALSVRRKGLDAALPQTFWKDQPPMLRPLTSLLQIRLENANYGDKAIVWALEAVEQLAASF